MVMKKIIFYLLVCTCCLASCNYLGSSPKKVFDTVGLNSNVIPTSFSNQFDEIRGQKRVGNLKVYSMEDKQFIPATALEYVTANYQNSLDPYIKKIQALKGNEESQPIIVAGLVMFQFMDDIYKNDYPIIAKMIDGGVPADEIDLAIEQLESTKGAQLNQFQMNTMDLLFPYADEHGIEYKVINPTAPKRK